MKKSVWIINQYASTPETGIGGRHYYLAQGLASLGYDVRIIAAGYSHILHAPPDIENLHLVDDQGGFKYVWLKMPSYSGAHSLRRIWNWFVFSWKLRKLDKILSETPDLIICSSPSLMSFLGAQSLSKRTSAKLFFEVRDIWPLTLQKLAGYSANHPFIRFLQWIEKKAYRESDHVLSNLPLAEDHMRKLGLANGKFTWIPNGFSQLEVDEAEPLSPEIRRQIPDDKFIIGYTGTLGLANSLDYLVQAAEQLKHNPQILFLIVGGGGNKATLREMVVQKKLNNVIFLDAIPKKQIQSMLSIFDACFVGYHKNDLYQFGVAPNKLFDYFYSAKPIIYAVGSGEYRPVEDANAGISVPPEDSRAISDAVLRLYSMSAGERDQMGMNGRNYAVRKYEYSEISKQLSSVINKYIPAIED